MPGFQINKLLNHPDKDEIISKIVIGVTEKDISEWLSAKYTNEAEKKFILDHKYLITFHKKYLNIYQHIRDDLIKTKEIISSPDQNIELSIKGNTAYKNKMLELAGKEVDIKQMITNVLLAIETRASQLFDEIQLDPRNINTRHDRMLKEWFDTLGSMIEKYHKLVNNAPDKIVQHNVTLQVVDQHITVFHDVIKEILSQMDVEASLYFIEMFNAKMSKLKESQADKLLPTETRLAEAKILNETIANKLGDI